MNKIVIAGGAGFLGQVLAKHFEGRGWEVAILARSPMPPEHCGRFIRWNGRELGNWTRELEGAAALINLCGRSVDCRYHARNRAEILNSRVEPTRVLAAAILGLETPPPVWINASSATIYRSSRDEPMDETDGVAGDGFSVEVCQAWEAAFFETKLPKTRRVALRASMVLGHGRNSVFPTLRRLVRLGMGGKMSRGDQLVSWIHELDFARAVAFAIEDDRLRGPINITAPAPVTNAVFMRLLRKALGVPFGLNHFKPMLEIAAWLMRTETELILKSRYAIPRTLLEHRFVFRFPFMDEALANLCAKTERNAEPDMEEPTLLARRT